MQNQHAARKETPDARPERHTREGAEFPVREYVGAMAAELAQMARWDGDERLGDLLDKAAKMAARPPQDAKP